MSYEIWKKLEEEKPIYCLCLKLTMSIYILMLISAIQIRNVTNSRTVIAECQAILLYKHALNLLYFLFEESCFFI